MPIVSFFGNELLPMSQVQSSGWSQMKDITILRHIQYVVEFDQRRSSNFPNLNFPVLSFEVFK